MIPRRTVLTLVGLVAVQGLLVLGYLGVEALRATPQPFVWESLDRPAPALVLEHAGTARSVPSGPHLVHFWASWCAPCLEELPGLLAAAEAESVPLLAVTEEPWPAVQAWFGDEVPGAVVRARGGEALERWRVTGLPDTFVVVDGRVVARAGGARDWTSRDARRFLGEVKR